MTAQRFDHYMTGAVRYKDGLLDELAIICVDPVPAKLEAMGYMEEEYVTTAVQVMNDMRDGAEFYACFEGHPKLYPIQIVRNDGKDTLEIADIGQAAEFTALRNLPKPGND